MRPLALIAATSISVGWSCADQQLDSTLVRVDPDGVKLVSPADRPLWGVRDVLHVDGTIWALTSSAPFVHRFGPNDTSSVTFGRSGEGPLDFRFPYSMWRGRPAGSLTVWDPGSFRAMTFSESGALLFALHTPTLGSVRSDIEDVAFGHPFRAVKHPGGIVVARYNSGVNHGTELWNGQLLRVPDDGSQPAVILDFASELPGSSRRLGASLLAPVPLWAGCPDHRIAVLDPIARILFMLSVGEATRQAIALPWKPGPLEPQSRLAYLKSRIRAELGDRGMSTADVDRFATETLRSANGLFPSDQPLGVDLKCAQGRVWIQEFDGAANPFGYGAVWRTVDVESPEPTFARVEFPDDFSPLRFSQSGAIGVFKDSLGLQRVAEVELSLNSAFPRAFPRTPSLDVHQTTSATTGELSK